MYATFRDEPFLIHCAPKPVQNLEQAPRETAEPDDQAGQDG